jgi:uncharacterized protein YcfJ
MPMRWLPAGCVAALSTALAATAAAADFTDYAPVVSAQPVYERVNTPRQECWNETVTVESAPAPAAASPGKVAAGTVIGGIVGGVAGHQVGSGRGNDVATVAGAIAGAMIGNNLASRSGGDPVVAAPPEQRVVQRCRTVDSWEDVIRGYDVTYRYGGRDATVRLPYDPGPRVRVAIGVVADGPPPAYGAPAPTSPP